MKAQKPDNVHQYIESWQKSLFQQFGHNPDGIEKRSIDNLKAILEKSELNGVDKKQLYKTLRSWMTTKYQDPIVIWGIANKWEEIRQLFIETWPEKKPQELENVLLATTPLPILNGLATKDASERHAVIFQEGLRFWPQLLGYYMSKFLLEEKGQYLIMANYADIDKVIQADPNLVSEILGTFVQYITKEGMLQLDMNKFYKMSQGMQDFAFHFQTGFQFFICSHEMSHCFNLHCDQLFKDSKVGYVYRNNSELEALGKQYQELTGEQLQLTKRQIERY
ncbi:MAG: hypothetical protein AAFZ15_14605, partial [Bacteroidota bacterium]